MGAKKADAQSCLFDKAQDKARDKDMLGGVSAHASF
jgi:hypothetical protein